MSFLSWANGKTINFFVLSVFNRMKVRNNAVGDGREKFCQDDVRFIGESSI